MFQSKLTVFTEEEQITLWHEPFGEPGSVRLYLTDAGQEAVYDVDRSTQDVRFAYLCDSDLDNLIEALNVMRERLKGDKHAR